MLVCSVFVIVGRPSRLKNCRVHLGTAFLGGLRRCGIAIRRYFFRRFPVYRKSGGTFFGGTTIRRCFFRRFPVFCFLAVPTLAFPAYHKSGGTFSVVMKYGDTSFGGSRYFVFRRYRLWRFPVYDKSGGKSPKYRDRPPGRCCYDGKSTEGNPEKLGLRPP